MTLLVKLLLTTAMVWLVSHVARQSTLWGGMLASMPIISVTSMIWMYYDTGDTVTIARFCHDVLRFLLPTLLFFVVVPWALQRGIPFVWALSMGLVVNGLGYAVVLGILRWFGQRT